MTGFLNAHGTLPCLFEGKFLDFSIVEDDEIRVGKVSVLDLSDNSPFAEDEPFDYDFEETFWSSLLLGADYDHDDEPDEDPLDWVQRRYADVIHLNDLIGYKRAPSEIISFVPSFTGLSHRYGRGRQPLSKMFRDSNPNRDHLRGKAHAK